MDESLELMILHGCNLAKNLEQNLPNLANLPHILLESCDEIVSAFTNVRERFNLSVGQMGNQELHGFEIVEHAMGLLDVRALARDGSAYLKRSDDVPESSEMKRSTELHEQQRPRQLGLEFALGEGDIASGYGGGIGGGAAPGFSIGYSSSQRQGRRKNESEKVVKRVVATQTGNADVLPEDGFTWKKYGQKEILGHAYPRSYFRCTHQKSHNCPAKKQAQRLDQDPLIFEVTYRGNHTCQPSAAVQPPPDVGHMPSMNIFHHLGGGTEAGSGQRFIDHQPVADMAEAMFNSSGSSSNSMDLIFSHMDGHMWDYSNQEKKD